MIYAVNKKAHFNYQILETWEAGLVLTGAEVKSVRNGNISLKEAYVTVSVDPKTKRPQAYLLNCHIAHYNKAGSDKSYQPDRTRRLVLHRREIVSIFGKIQQKGLTIIPLKVYTAGTKIKVEIGLGKGKKLFDKKETLKKRDLQRETHRELKQRK